MGADQALELMNQLLWNSLLVAGPVLVAALVVGLVISVLQVATQLQEMTLSYVPKLLAAVFVLIALGPVDDPPDHAIRDHHDPHDPGARLQGA